MTSTNIAQCNHLSLTLYLVVHKGSFLNGWSNGNICILPATPTPTHMWDLLQQYLLPALQRLFCRRFSRIVFLLVTKVRICHFCPLFVQLILSKVVETVEDKMHQIRFRLRLRPRLQRRSYSILRDARAGFQGSYLEGEGG